jgi:hypothetical protein
MLSESTPGLGHHRSPDSTAELSLAKDTLTTRVVQGPEVGEVVAIPQVGGPHHRYERRAAYPIAAWSRRSPHTITTAVYPAQGQVCAGLEGLTNLRTASRPETEQEMADGTEFQAAGLPEKGIASFGEGQVREASHR